jgi:hypothetical protein
MNSVIGLVIGENKMFKRIEGKIVEIDEGFSVENIGRDDLMYSQGENKLKIYSERLASKIYGYNLVLYTEDIKKWSSGELIDVDTKRQIINNVVRAFEWEGSKVRIDEKY